MIYVVNMIEFFSLKSNAIRKYDICDNSVANEV